MKVLVLGAGVIGVTAAYELAGAGHEVTVVDRQRGAGARDQLRQCRRGLAGLFGAVGRARRAAEGDQVAGDAPPAAGDPAAHRLRDDRAGCLAMLRNCTAARYEINKARMVRLAEYSRDCLRALRADTGIAYDERMQRHAAAVRTQKQFDGSADDIAVLRESGVAFELLDRDGCIRHEPALAQVQREVRRRPAPARRRDRRLLQVHPGARRARGRARRRRSASAPPIRAPGAQRRPHRRRRHRRRHARRRRLPRRARQLFAAAARADRHPHPGLSGQGLLDHRADRRRRRRTRIDGDGRDPQGRGDAPRRPHPRRRHGRARRLHPEAARGAPEDAGARRRRPLPARRRHLAGRVLVRPAADDARRHAGHRADADRQPLPRHRPRHARLDHGGRHRRG